MTAAYDSMPISIGVTGKRDVESLFQFNLTFPFTSLNCYICPVGFLRPQPPGPVQSRTSFAIL